MELVDQSKLHKHSNGHLEGVHVTHLDITELVTENRKKKYCLLMQFSRPCSIKLPVQVDNLGLRDFGPLQDFRILLRRRSVITQTVQRHLTTKIKNRYLFEGALERWANLIFSPSAWP